MPSLVLVEPVNLRGIGLAAIAASSFFGIKAGVGIMMPLPFIIVTIGRGFRAGGGAM